MYELGANKYHLVAMRCQSRPMHKKVLKGTQWMPRRMLPMKDVEDCEKSRGAVNKL